MNRLAYFASRRRSASQLWQRYSHTELAVTLDFRTVAAKAVTEARGGAPIDQERSDAARPEE